MIREVSFVFVVNVVDATEDYELLLAVVTLKNRHGMLTYSCKVFRFWNIFDRNPSFLVEHEQMHIIQEWDA